MGWNDGARKLTHRIMWCNGNVNTPVRSEASVLHVDMDSFFVSVELLERPELRGLPVAAAHDTGRSVVTSASYEARRFGVRSAMPVAKALQLCPRLILLPPTHEKYRTASRQVMQIFLEFTPLVEPLSIDEAFLDVSGSLRLFGAPIDIARQLRARVRERTGLTASVGLAASKFVAKLASQHAKPDGVLEVPPDRTLDFLHPLPVDAMWGVGRVTSTALQTRAIHTIGDLAIEPISSLTRLVGAANAQRLHDLANGRDAREVEPTRTEKSIGHEETFAEDQSDTALLERELLRLSNRTAERLRDHSLEARTIAIKVRWSNFETVTRSRTLPEATNATQRIYRTARELFAMLHANRRPVRLIGVRAEQLIPEGSDPAALWSDDEGWRAVDTTVDEVRERFGKTGILPASLLKDRGSVVDHRSLEAPD